MKSLKIHLDNKNNDLLSPTLGPAYTNINHMTTLLQYTFSRNDDFVTWTSGKKIPEQQHSFVSTCKTYNFYLTILLELCTGVLY